MNAHQPSALAAPGHDAVVVTRDVGRTLQSGAAPAQTILNGVSLSLRRAELVVLTGPSGSGKSTLLYLLGALDRPTTGRIWLDGTDVTHLPDDERAAFRNERLGFVFQFHFLLSEFSVLDNVALPMLRRGDVSRSEARERAYRALCVLGLGELYSRRPSQLSGGQQQRVSIARAVANDPVLILADEPTGNLDSKNAEMVFGIFKRLVAEQQRSIVMVSHDPNFASRADRRIELKDGRIEFDSDSATAPRLS